LVPKRDTHFGQTAFIIEISTVKVRDKERLMSVRGIYNRDGEPMGYVEGNRTYDLNGNQTGTVRGRVVLDLNGDRRWVIDRDAVLNLRHNVIGYLGESIHQDVLE
jgi:hypothetical protein